MLTAAVTFVLIPKTPKHYALFLLAALLAFRLAGDQVVERFSTAFAEEGLRDSSAQSRVELWKACLDLMAKNPLLGVGPDHFPLVASQYGFSAGKGMHSLWLQLVAEIGCVGLAPLASFYGFCVLRLWTLHRSRTAIPGGVTAVRCLVIVALLGFGFARQFVTLEGLEISYYVALLGGGVLKLSSQTLPHFSAPSTNESARYRLAYSSGV